MKKVGGQIAQQHGLSAPDGATSQGHLSLNDAISFVVRDTLPEQLGVRIETLSQQPAVQQAVYQSSLFLFGMQSAALCLAVIEEEDTHREGDQNKEPSLRNRNLPVPLLSGGQTPLEIETDEKVLQVIEDKTTRPLPELPRHSCDMLGSKRLARVRATAPEPKVPEFCKADDVDPNDHPSTSTSTSISGDAGMPGASDAASKVTTFLRDKTKYISYVVTSVLFLAVVFVTCGEPSYHEALSSVIVDPAFHYCVRKITPF